MPSICSVVRSSSLSTSAISSVVTKPRPRLISTSPSISSMLATQPSGAGLSAMSHLPRRTLALEARSGKTILLIPLLRADVAQPLLTVLAHMLDQRYEIKAHGGERVFDPRGHFRVALAREDAGLL